MLLSTLVASLLGNFLTGKAIYRAGEEMYRSGKGMYRSGEGIYRPGEGIKKSINATTSFNKLSNTKLLQK